MGSEGKSVALTTALGMPENGRQKGQRKDSVPWQSSIDVALKQVLYLCDERFI